MYLQSCSAVSWVQGSGPLSSHLLGLAGYRVTCMLGAAISTTSFLATAVLIHLEVTTFQPVDLDSYSLAILEYLNIIKISIYLFISTYNIQVTSIFLYYILTGAMSGLGLGFLYMVAR